jgi:SNF2 family DNA or RNA helicase
LHRFSKRVKKQNSTSAGCVNSLDWAKSMLNFRKLKQDFSSNIVKEGRELFDKGRVVSAKILHLDNKLVRISGRVLGQFENHYESTLEIDREECDAIDSDCDCPYNHDCQHLAALIFYLEEHMDKILVAYSKGDKFKDLAEKEDVDEKIKAELIEKVKLAETKQVQKQEELYQKQVLQEYITASDLLASSPFFRAKEKLEIDKADAAIIFYLPQTPDGEIKPFTEVQFALRLPYRSKPLYITNVKEFLENIRSEEPIFIAGRRYCFSLNSFEERGQKEIMKMVLDHAKPADTGSAERMQRVALIETEIFGLLLAKSYEFAANALVKLGFSRQSEEEFPIMPGLYEGSLESPLRFSPTPAALRFQLEYIKPPISKILLKPLIEIDQKSIEILESRLLECKRPGMLFKGAYYPFPEHITRHHLKNLKAIRDMTIPEPLFGTFVENALPELAKFVTLDNEEAIQQFVTMPFTHQIKATCQLSFLNGELEAAMTFHYDGHDIPALASQLTYGHVVSFKKKQGILARNLVEESKIIEELFRDFIFDHQQNVFLAKSEKKIVEFMTDIIPRNQHRVHFDCPQNLLDLFIYDQSTFKLELQDTSRIDMYKLCLKVDGSLKGVSLDLLWDCIASKRAFIELDSPRSRAKKNQDSNRLSKILVLDLEKTSSIVQLFDEMGVAKLDDHEIERPIWSLANIDASQFAGLPVEFSMTEKLKEIRRQMLGEKTLKFTEIPKEIQATMRSYQVEGVNWLERLRLMYLNGILADDMGLGKTLQAIVAISQMRKTATAPTLIVCPTSLVYNWKEECAKFNPKLKVLIVDGIPSQRKKLIESITKDHVVITSYTLLQKDVEFYKSTTFSYAVLDEAQHIKNRGTRNAKSVKQILAQHRLILSGTPIENSLDEMWSLFDFLMPGFLSSYDRFVEKYIRVAGQEVNKNLQYLKKKVSPFILRRMKSDVLDDLPPVSDIVYHCQLSECQADLYRSYAESARDELVKLVERDGFDRVQIHVLATLTRLKQICCHPAIFAKEKAEVGDSAKYDMLLELLQTLVESKHKTVIFSQYTRMLQIMREDFEQRGIRFSYLDGTSKNRLEIVKQFNEDESISVFLVSLKAGGTGLNLVGADTVIHYDMWWNPAVENQATDRVHRIGQKRSVSAYKLITMGTIEEKIAEMQRRKKGLVKKVVSCDDEAIAKLTWEDVLELLKT